MAPLEQRKPKKLFPESQIESPPSMDGFFIPAIPMKKIIWKHQEGANLPVPHCVRGTDGWSLCPEVAALCREIPVDKPTFGSVKLGEQLRAANEKETIESITLIGLCTDICVISNALLLKAFLPETPILVDASCCAGVTPESHRRALEAMKVCQIQIENG